MQITYFPYLSLKDSTEIVLSHDIKIWHFYSLAKKYIPDKVQRDFVTKLLDANVEGQSSEKIKNIAVASIGNTDFREFGPEEILLMHETKLILFLCKIAKTNTEILGSGKDGWTLSTSENFEPVFQNFVMGNNSISEKSGYIINLGILGYDISEYKFHKPSHVAISPFGLPLDKELLNKLLYIRDKKAKKLFIRILRATELLFQAYYNSSNVSINARILLIAAAFETLLDLPESQGRKVFKEYVEKFCDTIGEPKYRHYYYSYGKAKRDKNRSIKVLWADSFFQLRNHIIHGNVVRPEMYQFKNGDRHFDISVLFFTVLVKELINEKFDPKPFADKVEWGTRKDKSTGFFYEDKSLLVLLSKKIK